MLYVNSSLSLDAQRYLRNLSRLRAVLEEGLLGPTAGYGMLRRQATARSAHYSTRIEGNILTLSEVESILRAENIAAPANAS